jgi:hypothetical protein
MLKKELSRLQKEVEKMCIVDVHSCKSIIVTGASRKARKGCKFQLPQVATYMQVMIIASSLHLLETSRRSSICRRCFWRHLFPTQSQTKKT